MSGLLRERASARPEPVHWPRRSAWRSACARSAAERPSLPGAARREPPAAAELRPARTLELQPAELGAGPADNRRALAPTLARRRRVQVVVEAWARSRSPAR